VVTTTIHVEIMGAIGATRKRLSLSWRTETIGFVIAAFVAHLIDVTLYALAFAYFHHHPDHGDLAGEFGAQAVDFFYFSITCYTTLGFGDVYARGDMRVLAGVEALNGLVLIAWSAAFTFISLKRGWAEEADLD
jgi:hypothetical protein